MFRNILVPVDLSEKNQEAIGAAAELASARGASILVAHVVETIQDVPFQELEEFYDRLRRQAQDRMQGWIEPLRERGLSVRAEIAFGHRAREVLRLIEEEGCDLVVLHSHVLDPQRRGGGLGTLSHQIALAAPCPVLLMRPSGGA